MSNGSDIAAEINAALIEATEATGDGPMMAVLRKAGTPGGTPSRPTPGTPTLHTISMLDDTVRLRDATGTLTGETERVISLAAIGVVPSKSDRIQIRGDWFEIETVTPLAPGGVDLMYELTLVS